MRYIFLLLSEVAQHVRVVSVRCGYFLDNKMRVVAE